MVSVNPEFAALIPPLSPEERAGLERSILEEGVREPIITWRGQIVDGHNRYEIATEHGIDFETAEYDFADEAAAKLWMISNQKSRRNLSESQTAMLTVLERELVEPISQEAQKREHAGTKDPLAHGREGWTSGKLAELSGSSQRTIERAIRVRDSGDEKLVQQVLSGEVSVRKAEEKVKRAERQAAIEEAKAQPRSSSYVDIFSTDKKYRVVYADPPWSYNDKQDTSRLGGAEKHYGTMAIDEICDLEISTCKDAVLFLWATSPLLPEAFAVIDSWGFEYKTSFVWDKVSTGLGHYNSVRHELLLVCTKGNCTPDSSRRFDSVVSIKRTEHSVKPDFFRDMIDELYPIGERIELFAREAHEGWDVWGDMA